MEIWTVTITEPGERSTVTQTTRFFENHSNALEQFNEDLPDDWTLGEIQESDDDESPDVIYDGLMVTVIVEPGVTVSISPRVTQEETWSENESSQDT